MEQKEVKELWEQGPKPEASKKGQEGKVKGKKQPKAKSKADETAAKAEQPTGKADEKVTAEQPAEEQKVDDNRELKEKKEQSKDKQPKEPDAKKSDNPFRAGSKKAYLFKLLLTTETPLTRDEISEKMENSGNMTSHSVISSWLRSIKRKGFTVEVTENEQKKATYRVLRSGESTDEKNDQGPNSEKSVQ